MLGGVRITDPLTMRALAHPLRLDLLELLGLEGPMTAARCGKILGTGQANCSFHLRQLAKYGLVEEAPTSGDRRERPWQVVDIEQSWSSVTPDGASRHLDVVMAQREADRRLNWVSAGDREPGEWRKAAFFGGATVPVTTSELEALGDSLRALLTPYIERIGDRSAWPANARPVRILLGATPLPDQHQSTEASA